LGAIVSTSLVIGRSI